MCSSMRIITDIPFSFKSNCNTVRLSFVMIQLKFFASKAAEPSASWVHYCDCKTTTKLQLLQRVFYRMLTFISNPCNSNSGAVHK